MTETSAKEQICLVIGASHAGVSFAFALRRQGWLGEIVLFDADPMLPYHRPPLSKAYLASDKGIEKHLLKSPGSYEKERISLRLGIRISAIDRKQKRLILADGSSQNYDKLVIATGARPLFPKIKGLDQASNLFPLRRAIDTIHIRQTLRKNIKQKVVIIGGGYIGLETAASLKEMNANVFVLEREERVLARVTSPLMSEFYEELHAERGVKILTQKNVISFEKTDDQNLIICDDDTRYKADLIVLGVGIRVNSELAEAAGLAVKDGICVDQNTKTDDPDIYAIGDCTYHYNPHYDRFVRLESVQNAVEQGKIAAASICGKDIVYDIIPWFWSDQYEYKLQMIGLSNAYDQAIVRKEAGERVRFSVWYFKEQKLIAVDAVNYAKAYVLGAKFIKSGARIDQAKLVDPEVEFKPNNLLAE